MPSKVPLRRPSVGIALRAAVASGVILELRPGNGTLYVFVNHGSASEFGLLDGPGLPLSEAFAAKRTFGIISKRL